MAIRKQLGPWQEQLVKILIRRWGARHGGIWPDAKRSRYVRGLIRAAVSRDHYGRRGSPGLPYAASRRTEAQREMRAKAQCLKLLQQEAAGQWQADAHVLAVREAGLWRELFYDHVEVRHEQEAAIRAHACAERERYYVLPDRRAGQP